MHFRLQYVNKISDLSIILDDSHIEAKSSKLLGLVIDNKDN